MKSLLPFAALVWAGAASAEPAPQVVIEHFTFGPNAITVPAGATVTWVNKDVEPHTVVSNERKFQSEALDTGDRFSVTFDKPGSYGYFCSLHPHMTGKVVVVAR